jgi:hypothetical protein
MKNLFIITNKYIIMKYLIQTLCIVLAPLWLSAQITPDSTLLNYKPELKHRGYFADRYYINEIQIPTVTAELYVARHSPEAFAMIHQANILSSFGNFYDGVALGFLLGDSVLESSVEGSDKLTVREFVLPALAIISLGAGLYCGVKATKMKKRAITLYNQR